jgi:hypothetical protein
VATTSTLSVGAKLKIVAHPAARQSTGPLS